MVSSIRGVWWSLMLRLLYIDGREGDSAWGRGSRDTWVGSVTCDDWENGLRDKVDELLRD